MLLPLALLTLACSDPSVTAGTAFTLQLTPLAPDGQDPFVAGAELTLRVTPADGGDPVDHALGASASASWELPDLDPLRGDAVGLILTGPNGQLSPVIDYDDLIASGQTPPLTLSTGTATVPVVLAGYGAPGVIGRLPFARAAYLPAVAVLPDGDVLLFGGTDDPLATTYPASTAILQLSRLDADLAFDQVGDIPSMPNTGNQRERVGAAATVVTVDGQVQVLVTGGRRWFAPATTAVSQSFLWEPAGARRTWDAAMLRARSQHAAARVGDDVLIMGGLDGTGKANFMDVEWFRAATSSFEPNGTDVGGAGSLGFGWADLGDDGVLMCGGGVTSADSSLLLPQSGCRRVEATGAVFPVDDIATGVPGMTPIARQFHAMAPLPNNRVLLCGGTGESVPTGGDGDAVADAWIYDQVNRTWSQAGSMNTARAMHQAIPLPDGRVLILGGTTTAVGISPLAFGAPIDVPEIFDPASNTFEELPPSPAGAGGLPAVSLGGPHGAFALAGLGIGVDALDYGVVGLGP